MSDERLWQRFHEAGFDVLWYANPHPVAQYRQERYGGRWHAGVETGKDGDLICVKEATTREEGERFLSPSGWTPEEATELALKKLEELGC